MNQAELVATLDRYFSIQNFDEKGFWPEQLPSVYKASAQPYFVPQFWNSLWNGLMLDNTQGDIDRVYLVVFPTASILDTIIAKEVGRGAPGCLIFAHHPLPYQEKGAGFTEIPIAQLEELREHAISFYSCHAPLDCHPETSTANALANALGLTDIQRFGRYYGGLAGVYGTVPPVSFQDFAERVAETCELNALRYDQLLHIGRQVHQVAVLAGGGGNANFMDAAMNVGADTYVTGHWHLFADNTTSTAHRAEQEKYLPAVTMNLIGASHYGSEMVVLRDQMKDWFAEQFEVEVVLIRQKDPWG